MSSEVSSESEANFFRGGEWKSVWLLSKGAAQLNVRLKLGLPNIICMMKVKGAFECLQCNFFCPHCAT